MNVKKIACLVFSPTGGTLEMIEGIKGFINDYDIKIYNVTRPKNREKITEIPKDIDYLIIGSPVYGDRLPDIFKEYLKILNVSGIPVSLIVGYGNVDKGKALSQASIIIESKGNIVCSACAIVTKHSYNRGRVQLAVNEPTIEKMELLNQFILKSIEKVKKANNLSMCKTYVPKGSVSFLGRFPQRLIPRIYLKLPTVNLELCVNCNTCIDVCPVSAIDEELSIDSGKCTGCLACVKYCPSEARRFDTRFKILEYVLIKDGKNIKENGYYI